VSRTRPCDIGATEREASDRVKHYCTGTGDAEPGKLKPSHRTSAPSRHAKGAAWLWRSSFKAKPRPRIMSRPPAADRVTRVWPLTSSTRGIADRTNPAPAGPYPYTVRHYFILLALAVAVPLVGLAFYASWRVAEGEREATQAALLSNARSLAAAVNREIEKHIAVGTTLAHSSALLAGDWTEFRRQADAVLPYLSGSWLSVVDPSGQVRLNTLATPDVTLPHRPLLAAEQQALDTGQPVVSDVITGVVMNRRAAFVAIPVLRDGRPAYVVDITLNPDRFSA